MSGSSQQGEPGVILVFIAVILFLFSWFIWHQFKHPILEFFRWARLAEFWIIHLITGKDAACIDWLRHVRFGDTTPPAIVVSAAQECFGNAYLAHLPADMSFDHYRLSAAGMADIERLITGYDRWVLTAACIGVGGYVMFLSPRHKFKTRHTLESFIKVQAKMWPVIWPIVNFNPNKFSARRPGDKIPDKIPPFAEAFSPEEWIAWHRIPVVNNIPDREAVRRAFLLQLGPRWHGIEGMPVHVQALFAAYALKGVQRREDSDHLLGELSLCWSVEHGLKISSQLMGKIKQLIKDPEVGGKAAEIASQHAYRTTAMIGILKWARFQGGVLAPAQFLWLRAVDRGLWYPLNNLGRRSFHTEGAGAMAHFMAEQIAKRPLPVPRIDTAIITLNQYMAQPTALPIPIREGDSAGSTTLPVKKRK